MAEYIEKEKASRILREEAVAHYPTAFHVGLYAAARAIDSIPAADVVPGSDFRDCRNELCLRCGEYTRRHLGACDGCRWRDA